MPSRYSSDNVEVIRDMRRIEKALSDLHTRIKLYASIYKQSKNRIEALKMQYNELNDGNASSIEDEPEYKRAIEKMKIARNNLDRLEKERDLLRKVIQDNMHRF